MNIYAITLEAEEAPGKRKPIKSFSIVIDGKIVLEYEAKDLGKKSDEQKFMRQLVGLISVFKDFKNAKYPSILDHRFPTSIFDKSPKDTRTGVQEKEDLLKILREINGVTGE